MDPVRPDPNTSNPDRLLPEDNDTTTFEISKKQQQPETPPSSSVTVNPTLVPVDEDNDGFRTPVNQAIPAITECPPAPRKTRMPLRKRKGIDSPSTITSARKRIQIDPTEEEFVDALFSRDVLRGKIIKKGAV